MQLHGLQSKFVSRLPSALDRAYAVETNPPSPLKVGSRSSGAACEIGKAITASLAKKSPKCLCSSATRLSKLIVDDPLSTPSRLGAPGVAVAESSSPATTIVLAIHR